MRATLTSEGAAAVATVPEVHADLGGPVRGFAVGHRSNRLLVIAPTPGTTPAVADILVNWQTIVRDAIREETGTR